MRISFAFTRALCLLSALVVALACFQANGQDTLSVKSYLLAKGMYYRQTNQGPAFLPAGQAAYTFYATVDPFFQGEVISARLRKPSGLFSTLTNVEEEAFRFAASFLTKSNLDAAFPPGAYTFFLDTLSDGKQTNRLTLVSNIYPATPHISNWEAAHDIDASADFTLNWDPFTGGTTSDYVFLEISDPEYGPVFSTPDITEPDVLTGTSTGVQIPANTLLAGRAYEATLTFFKRTGLNTTAYPGVPGFSGYFKETDLTLRTWVEEPAAGRLQFSASQYILSETGAMASIVITRDRGNSGQVSVNFSTGDATANAGSDYAVSSQTVTLQDGQTSATIRVPILDDWLLEGTQTVLLSLQNPAGAILGPQSTAVLQILDNESALAGTLQFSSTNYTVSETGRWAVIKVLRTGATNRSVAVSYATQAGTALPGTDYTNLTGSLTFAPGVTSRTISVPIVNNTLVEPNKTVLLCLTSATGGASLGSRTNALLTIVNDDAGGTIGFKAPLFTVSEAATPAVITVVRTGGLASQVTVDFATADGSGAAGVNYAPVSGTLTFGAGQLSQTITVPIIPNNLPDGNKELHLALSNPTGGSSLGTLANTALRILDDEVVLQFSTNNYTVSEGAASATITVRRSGATNNTVSVTYATSDGTAVNGLDYTNRTGTLTFGPGVQFRTFTVPLKNDTLVEGPETVNLSLSNPTGTGLLGPLGTAVLTITDNDVGGVINFSASTYTAYETGRTARITVTRTGGVASGVTVNYATADLLAKGGEDYTATSGTLSFAAGQSNQVFYVPLLNNTRDESALTVALNLSNAGGGASLGSRSAAVLTIIDDDVGGVLNFKTNLFRVSETGTVATITVVRSGGAAGQVSVDYETGDGTALQGTDYIRASGQLLFGPGEKEKTFTIAIVNNENDEPDKRLVLHLANPTGGARLGSVATAELLILDDDTNGIYADFATSKGNFTCRLDYTNAPKTVANFIGLATGEKSWLDWDTGQVRTGPFYNGLIFHRVIKNFMIQSGSPNGSGTDGPGYVIRDEITSQMKHNRKGLLAMANIGSPHTAGSQFYITVTNNASWLDGGYTIFGLVVSNYAVVEAISKVATAATNNKPLTDVVIQSITIRRIGEAAKNFNVQAQPLPQMEEVPLHITDTGNQQISIAFSNNLYAHHRLFSTITTNAIDWEFLDLGVDVAAPLRDLTVVTNNSPARTYVMTRAQYPSSTFAPPNMRSKTLKLFYSLNSVAETNTIVLNATGTGTYTSSSGGRGTLTSYDYYQDIYRGYLWPIAYSELYPMALRLEFTSSSGGTFEGTVYFLWDSIPWYSISGKFTLASP